MNWQDTVGVTIHNDLVRSALKNKPEADIDKLEASIKRMSLSVGITRMAIASVLDAEIEAMAAYRVLGDSSITNEYLSGMQSAADLVRYGVHLTDGIKL
jgi:microsomal dipeptidase-like Zn-dependent dipeptidase